MFTPLFFLDVTLFLRHNVVSCINNFRHCAFEKISVYFHVFFLCYHIFLYHELQEERKQTLPSLHDDNDSDSTLVLMAGFTNEPTEEEDVLNQPNAKIKGKEKGDLAHNGLTLNSLLNHGTFSIFF